MFRYWFAEVQLSCEEWNDVTTNPVYRRYRNYSYRHVELHATYHAFYTSNRVMMLWVFQQPVSRENAVRNAFPFSVVGPADVLLGMRDAAEFAFPRSGMTDGVHFRQMSGGACAVCGVQCGSHNHATGPYHFLS